MSAKRKPTPSYLPHRQSGRARAVWTDSSGQRHQRLLPGPFDSAESRTAFARLQLELAVSPLARPADGTPGASVNEVLLAFLDHAERHYRRDDGTQTHEVDEYKLVCRYVRRLYGHTPAEEFGPLALKSLRQAFIDAGWCRSLVNQRVGRVRRVFKRAAAEELVTVAVYQALATVQGLQRGRGDVREAAPVEPVSDEVVDVTLPFLNRHVRGMVAFQRLTGCRPGEVCAVRMLDIDTTGPVWLYRPRQHKTAWRGKRRTVAVGPKAQEVLRAFDTGEPDAYLFSPARAVAEFHADRAAKRKTPRYPSHVSRNARVRVRAPGRRPAEVYDVNAYGHAIARACDRVFPPPTPLGRTERESAKAWRARLTVAEREAVKEWQARRRWHPNQLRHTFASRVRRDHGLEAAQVLLGHARADVTQVYAERDEKLAVTVAAVIG